MVMVWERERTATKRAPASQSAAESVPWASRVRVVTWVFFKAATDRPMAPSPEIRPQASVVLPLSFKPSTESTKGRRIGPS